MSDPGDLNAGGPSGGDTRTERGRRWLLIGSLALNLVVVGWLAIGALHWTGVWHGRHDFWHGDRHGYLEEGRWHGGRGTLAPRGAMRAFLFDRPDDPALAALYDRHGPGLREAFDDARAARRQVHDLVEAAEHGGAMDKAALESALAAVRAATTRVQSRMHAAFLDAADTLPPDVFEDLVEHRGARHHRHDEDD